MQHKFVEFVPHSLEENILYISMEYKTVAHLCCCGCREKVITPITPTDWTLTYNGVGISLHPSIGNWNFKCKSHYWIKNNQVMWAGTWDEKQIHQTQIADALKKQEYYQNVEEAKEHTYIPKISKKLVSFFRSIFR